MDRTPPFDVLNDVQAQMIEKALIERLDHIRTQIEDPDLDIMETTLFRGRIQQLKEILGMLTKPPRVPVAGGYDHAA